LREVWEIVFIRSQRSMYHSPISRATKHPIIH
jgi:hypothetical protein